MDHHITLGPANLKEPNNFEGRHPTSAPHRDKVKIDFAVHRDVAALSHYTVKMDGVTVAKIPLLLVEKIVASAERQLPLKSNKVVADLDDILFCLNNLMKKKNAKVPDDDLLRYRLTKEVWRGFWDRLKVFKPEELEKYRRLLREVGLLR